MDQASDIRRQLNKSSVIGNVGYRPLDDVPNFDLGLWRRGFRSETSSPRRFPPPRTGGARFLAFFFDAAQIRTAHLVLPDYFYRDLVSWLDDVADVVHVPRGEVRNVDKPFRAVL